MLSTGVIVGIIIAVIVFLGLLGIITGIRIVPQANIYVVERLGKYHATWETGIHLRLPVIDKIAVRVSLKEQVLNIEPQTVITKDNVTMKIDAVLFYVVTDAQEYTYGVAQPIYAIQNLTATTLRSAIGELELDRTLNSRETINSKLQLALDEACNNWGIKVLRVEVKNILPPADVRNAMEQQMRAEREKRARILTAEGNKMSQILMAEGNREATIKKAEGAAKALIIQQQALADSINILNEARPSPATLKLRSYDTLWKMANGNATKLVIPSDMQNIGRLAATGAETWATVKEKPSQGNMKLASLIKEMDPTENMNPADIFDTSADDNETITDNDTISVSPQK